MTFLNIVTVFCLFHTLGLHFFDLSTIKTGVPQISWCKCDFIVKQTNKKNMWDLWDHLTMTSQLFLTGDHCVTHSKCPTCLCWVRIQTLKKTNAFYMAACTVGYNTRCMLVGKPVSSSCPVEISPPRAVVRIGDPFSANCNTSSDRVEEMGWESSNGGTSLTTGVSSLPLNIASVTDWGLEPKCFINLDPDQCFQTMPVTVYSKLPLALSKIAQQTPCSF